VSGASIKRLRQVFLVATDFEQQLDFFERALGIKQKFRDGAEWAQFDTGETSLALAGPREALGAAPGTSVPVFEVADLDAFLAAVLAGGGSHGAVRDMGAHGRTALARDPSGAVIAALQKA
jgi:predicted enzyme related to lactoylglutathione lyase